MPEIEGVYPNNPESLTYIEDWEKSSNDWVPMSEPELHRLQNLSLPAPRCPNIPKVESMNELLPNLEAVARRPYSGGLWPAWDLKEGEKVLVRVSSWHHPLVIEAVKKVLAKFKTDFVVEIQDKGPIPKWQGHDEAEYYQFRTRELAEWIDDWEKMDKEGKWDKVIMGYGGPILRERRIKIQRMPFIVPEAVISDCHSLPAEVLVAIDEWTWSKVRECRKVHITDPEGTDLRYTNHDAYWSNDRTVYRRDHVEKHYSSNVPYGETYLPGHIWGRPPFFVPQEDGEGVIKGTMNHIAPYPRMEMRVKNSVITHIKGGGIFGQKLRKIMKHTAETQYSGYNEPGIMQWWEASIGTSPKIHRPRENYATGFNCGLYERMRAGIIHIGFGTIISADTERADAKAGKFVGHWHVHLYFPTYVAEGGPDGDVTIIEHGRLKALDDPEVRAVAAKYGNPDVLLREDWIPAIPGMNIAGDYNQHYAKDPYDYTMLELDLCRKYHPLFQKMIQGASGRASNEFWQTHTSGTQDVKACCSIITKPKKEGKEMYTSQLS
ncbi:hypothetical protein NM208_g5132 [Fusarium decemcellulare]|uniref:Uncharacterized protein n=1 Tax=Fusarium decemcellulare TaxID=57161 RepID=A0ACC1SI28_9HYPO|nr:hypothetical protein NM208_g5132 [Fusarium decemcellulare]